MFKINYFYNPIVKHHENGEMSVSIYISNGKKTKIICTLYDKNYHKLMTSVNNYIKFNNEFLNNSIKKKINNIISLYI